VTHSQRLLLRAALLEGEPALDAWREWNEREVVEELDGESDRLIGLLWRNLDAHGVEHETMPKLKGVYRHTWFTNQSVLRQAGVPIRALREAGIPTLALKGATLCPLYYRDWGVRRMEDFDLLVPPDRVGDAMATLRAIGAQPGVADVEDWIPLRHSVMFGHPDGWTMDLHWYSLWRSASDRSLWDQAVPIELGGEQTLAPGATHQLLVVCVHGADWAEHGRLRAIADALAVIRGGEVDWDLLVEEARARLVTVALASMLERVRELVDAPVPDDVLRRLHETPSPRFERVGYRETARPYSLRFLFATIWERQRRFARLRPGGPGPEGLLRAYYDFFRLNWGVAGPGEFSRRAALAGARLVGRQVTAARARLES
jgi:hypothetical protein